MEHSKGEERCASRDKSEHLSLTTEQLKDRPDLVAIDGVLYDLDAIAPRHPGGEVIRASGAYDASALFHSMHPGKDTKSSELLCQNIVGTHLLKPGIDPVYMYNSPFAVDLLRSVRKEMRSLLAISWYAPRSFWIRILVIAMFTLFFECNWMFTGHWMWGILCGCMHAQIGLSIQHDASHGALSRNPRVNAFFAYGADWIGNSRWIWFQQHILWHHPHTNHQTLDPDARSAEPFLVFSDYSKKGPARPPRVFEWAKCQDLVTHAVLSLYGVSVVFNPYVASMRHNEHIPKSITESGGFMSNQKLTAWCWRLFYVARMILLPWWNGASLLCASILVHTVTGILLTFVFVISHNFEESDRDPSRLAASGSERNGGGNAAKRERICWYKSQAETSCSYGGSTAMFLTGGLNLQIEHHLFPRLSSWYYPSIQKAVRSCCKRHGVRYKYYPTLASNVVSMLRYMRKVGVVLALREAHAHSD